MEDRLCPPTTSKIYGPTRSRFRVLESDGKPMQLALRLKLAGGKIAEAELAHLGGGERAKRCKPEDAPFSARQCGAR